MLAPVLMFNFFSYAALLAFRRADAHLVQDGADRIERAAHVIGIEPADAADAERIRDRELAGINHVAALLQPVVEILEHEFLLGRHAEGDDDRRLQVIGQQRLETERPHALDQNPAILGVTPAAPGDAALGVEFRQSLMEGDDDMDRRREAVLAGLDEIAPLVVQVEHQRCRVALGFFQHRLAADHETQTRHAFDAFVGRCRHRVERRLRGVERNGAESAHGVDQQRLAVAANQIGQFRNRIEDAGGGLAMDGEDVGDRRVAFEQSVNGGEIGRRIFRRLIDSSGAAGDVADLLGPVAIGAVDHDKHLALARNQACQHGLHRESARALHRHCHEFLAAIDQGGEPGKHGAIDLDKARVARAPVVNHRFLHRPGSRQRPGREKQRIAGFAHGCLSEFFEHSAAFLTVW